MKEMLYDYKVAHFRTRSQNLFERICSGVVFWVFFVLFILFWFLFVVLGFAWFWFVCFFVCFPLAQQNSQTEYS